MASKAVDDLKAELKAHISDPEPIGKYSASVEATAQKIELRRAARRPRHQSHRYQTDQNRPSTRREGEEGGTRNWRQSHQVLLSQVLGASPSLADDEEPLIRKGADTAFHISAHENPFTDNNAEPSSMERIPDTGNTTCYFAGKQRNTSKINTANEPQINRLGQERKHLEEAGLIDGSHSSYSQKIVKPNEDPEQENAWWEKGYTEEEELEAQRELLNWQRRGKSARVEEWLTSAEVGHDQLSKEAEIRARFANHFREGGMMDNNFATS